MSPAWNQRREKRLVRAPDGTFKEWTGGEPDDRDSSAKGNYIHLSAQFRKQEGRAAEVGDVTRHKNLDGSYNRQSMFYTRTEVGWRRSTTEKRKPTADEIRRQSAKSRRHRR